MLQKSILIPALFFAFSFLSAEQVAVDRPEETDVTMGSRISDIPYGYYVDSLSPQMIKVIDSLDLSAHGDKRIFVGYGVYDKENDQCKYLEGGFTKHDFDLEFHHLKVFSNHSYAISREPKTVSQCMALAATFHGHLFTPGSAVENQAIIGRNSLLYEDEGWLGIYRKNCIEPFKNILDQEITYTNFYESIDNCAADKLFVYKKQNTSLWSKGNESELKYCIVEFESPEVTRPVKVCAPWWRIERTYKLPPQDEIMINGVMLDLYNINQATLPKRMTTCLEYNEDINSTSLPDREVICKSYYDITRGETCIADLIQPQCFVDTCEGYIKNVCSKNDIQPSADGKVKDYVWGYITQNGLKIRVKVKDKIRSHAYTCPPSAAAVDKCILTGDVIVYPYQCNPDVCVNFKHCIGEKTKTRTECHALYPCEEVYGDSNQPVVENGELVGFRAKCGEEMVVNRQINKLSKTTEKCLKYRDIVDVITETKKCTVSAHEEHFEVSAAITEQDVFLDREDCIRLNDIDDARPKLNLAFKYVNKGFFDLALVRTTFDGVNDTRTEDAPNSLANDLQYMIRETVGMEGETPTAEAAASQCADWKSMRLAAFSDGNETWSGLVGILRKSSVGSDEMLAVVKKDADISYIEGVTGLTYDPNAKPNYNDYPFDYLGLSSSDIDSGEYVFLFGSAVEEDRFFWGTRAVSSGNIPSSGTTLENMDIEASTVNEKKTGTDCKDYAKCIGLQLLTQYSTDLEQKVCEVTTNTITGIIDETPPEVTQQGVEYPEYETTEDVVSTSIDGTRDIFSIQEYADGKFGYISNYHYLLPHNNEVYLEGKEIFPIVPQYPLDLELNYAFYVKNYTQRTKNTEPDIQQGSFEGTRITVDVDYLSAIGAGAGVGGALVLAGFAAYAGPVGIVVAVLILLFAGSTKYGDLTTDWKIYEPTPKRYVANIYGYDLRETVPGMKIYSRERFLSPTAEDDDFEKFLSDYSAHKRSLLYNQGYDQSLVDSVLLRPCEANVCGGYPGKGKWYKFKWHKRLTKIDNDNILVSKPINTLYLGATNTVSIFVPYLGDYLVTAYSATGNILGQKLIKTDDFIPGTATRMSYANINFATSNQFGLANGVPDGNVTGACRYDMATEWGGGVSGVYYEHHTPQGNVCAKSNDEYVQTSYADYITIRPIKSNEEFKIKMIRPMPYANRFNLVTYGKLENRKYICYIKDDQCEP